MAVFIHKILAKVTIVKSDIFSKSSNEEIDPILKDIAGLSKITKLKKDKFRKDVNLN